MGRAAQIPGFQKAIDDLTAGLENLKAEKKTAMPRLIDDIRVHGVQMPFWIAEDRQHLWQDYATRMLQMLRDPQLPVLLIDNVAEHYLSGSDQEYWDLTRDFPNLAPPFPQFWAEHKIAKTIHSKDAGDTDLSRMLGKDARVGCLVTTVRPANAKTDGEPIPPEAKWLLWMDLFIHFGWGRQGPQPQGPHGAMFLMVDGDGRIIGTPWMQSYCSKENEPYMKSLMAWIHPVLLAVSFLHCKNVVLQDESVPKPLAKKYHLKTGQWPTRYKTLVIEPLKQILRHEGGSDRHGLAKAMHICRGHFRDYRTGPGLFGKYHQLVWTPSVVRGTKGKSAPPREIQVKV